MAVKKCFSSTKVIVDIDDRKDVAGVCILWRERCIIYGAQYTPPGHSCLHTELILKWYLHVYAKTCIIVNGDDNLPDI